MPIRRRAMPLMLRAIIPRCGSNTCSWMKPVCIISQSLYRSLIIRLDFHCVMAMSVFVLNNLLISREDPKEAIRHLLQTFHLVNQRISENQPVSETTLAVVVSMAQYSRLQGQYRQGLVHLEGLRQMIGSRGGCSQLTKFEPGLNQMIFK